jgi:hypothetical protein
MVTSSNSDFLSKVRGHNLWIELEIESSVLNISSQRQSTSCITFLPLLIVVSKWHDQVRNEWTLLYIANRIYLNLSCIKGWMYNT